MASEKTWNSPTTLYMARRIASLRRGGLAVLDLGCGDGTVLEHLLEYGHDLFGCDLPAELPAARTRMGPHLGPSFDHHIRAVTDERRIPFGDSFFDVVYANQVFEHLRDLDTVLGECARVLKHDGLLLATFPPATGPMEVHVSIPFAHWLPPGRLRVRYLQLCVQLGLGPPGRERTARQTAEDLDAYLKEQTFYRATREIVATGDRHFGRSACETGRLIGAKLELLRAAPRPMGRFAAAAGLANGAVMSFLVTRLVIAAYAFSSPRKG